MFNVFATARFLLTAHFELFAPSIWLFCPFFLSGSLEFVRGFSCNIRGYTHAVFLSTPDHPLFLLQIFS